MRATGSVDADGGALSYAWSISGKPAGSSAVLSRSTSETSKITVDVAGTYTGLLRVTDSEGAFSEVSKNSMPAATRPLPWSKKLCHRAAAQCRQRLGFHEF